MVENMVSCIAEKWELALDTRCRKLFAVLDFAGGSAFTYWNASRNIDPRI